MKVSQVKWRYMREMALAFILYFVLLAGSIAYGRPLPAGLPRTIVLFSPMLGFVGMIWAISRHVGAIDEYQRKFMLETWALAAAVTAAVTFSYGFLETAGYPKISMFSVWMIMGAAWVAVGCGRAVFKR